MICNLCKNLEYIFCANTKILVFQCHASKFVYMIKETLWFGFTLKDKMENKCKIGITE